MNTVWERQRQVTVPKWFMECPDAQILVALASFLEALLFGPGPTVFICSFSVPPELGGLRCDDGGIMHIQCYLQM